MSFREDLVRLAYENKDLRSKLLPLIKESFDQQKAHLVDRVESRKYIFELDPCYRGEKYLLVENNKGSVRAFPCNKEGHAESDIPIVKGNTIKQIFDSLGYKSFM